MTVADFKRMYRFGHRVVIKPFNSDNIYYLTVVLLDAHKKTLYLADVIHAEQRPMIQLKNYYNKWYVVKDDVVDTSTPYVLKSISR